MEHHLLKLMELHGKSLSQVLRICADQIEDSNLNGEATESWRIAGIFKKLVLLKLGITTKSGRHINSIN